MGKAQFKNAILGLLMILLGTSSLQACYFYGGDISWECVGQDSFLVKFRLYRDCNAINPGPAYIPISCKSGSTLTSLTISVPSPVDITPTCASSCTRCQSAGCAFPYGVKEYIYQKIVYLGNNIPSSCCEIIMSYSMCCRMATITTGAANQNFYIEAMMNRCVSPCDNSPQFTKSPVILLCKGQDFVFNYGAVDMDTTASGSLLDSLAYEWSHPLSASGTVISYTGQYDYDKPIYFWGFPNATLSYSRGFHLDEVTGEIAFRPMNLEQTVMVITVKEYRYDSSQKKRVLIGQVSRDIQVDVLNCPNNTSPVSGGALYYNEVCAGDEVEILIRSNDYDSGDTLHIYWDQAIPGASWSDNNGQAKHPKGVLKWTPGINDVSSIPYTFTVTVEDDACPLKGQATRAYRILVKPPVEIDVAVADSGCGMVWFNDKNNSFPTAKYDWSFEGLNFSGKKFSHQFLLFGDVPYSVTKTDGKCEVTYQDTIRVDTFVQLQKIPEQKVCYGDSIQLDIHYKYNKGGVGGIWNGVTGALNKSYYIDHDVQLVYGCIDSGDGCAVYDTVRIDMLEPAVVDLGPDIHLCSGDSQLVVPKFTIIDIDTGITFWRWLQQAKTDTVLGYTIGDSGTYVCFFKDTFGCVGMDTLEVRVNPEVHAFANGVTICQGDTAWLSASETGTKTSNVSYTWYFGNKIVATGRKVFFNPITTSTYRLLVKEVLGGTECQDFMDVVVQVNLLPEISIDPIEARCVSGLNSQALKLSDYVLTNPVNCNTKWSYWPDPNALQGGYFYPSIAGTGNHIVTIKATDPITSCVSYDSSNIKINPLPNVDAGLDDTLCTEGDVKLLAGYPSDPPGSWSNVGSHQGVENHSTYWSFNPKASGIVDGGSYGIVYDYTDSNGCENTDTAFMVVYKNPVADAGIYDTFCAYDLEDPLNGLPLNGIWFGNGIVNNHFNPSFAGSGSHELVYEVLNHNCADKDTVFVEVLPIPVAGFEILSTGNEYEVRFNDLSSPGTGSLKAWRWYFGDGDTSVQKDPVHVYSGSGDYEVSLMVSDDGVCTDIYTNFIHVENNTVGLKEENDQSILIYPNPFEDKVYIKSSVPMQQIEVYDMLGKRMGVFEDLYLYEKEIDFSENKAGIFILKVHFKDQNSFSYLIVKR